MISIYVLMSTAAFIAIARDKGAAKRGARRTPEKTLHALELLAGWPGALAARSLYRHKTKKLSYRIVAWGIAGLHILAWVTYLWIERK